MVEDVVIRVVSDKKIKNSIQKGFNRAGDIFKNQPKDETERREYYLDQFVKKIDMAEHLLENLNKKTYEDRGYKKERIAFLRSMLLSSFDAVQCAAEIGATIHYDRSQIILESYKERLEKAVAVFESNGDSDTRVGREIPMPKSPCCPNQLCA